MHLNFTKTTVTFEESICMLQYNTHTHIYDNTIITKSIKNKKKQKIKTKEKKNKVWLQTY